MTILPTICQGLGHSCSPAPIIWYLVNTRFWAFVHSGRYAASRTHLSLNSIDVAWYLDSWGVEEILRSLFHCQATVEGPFSGQSRPIASDAMVGPGDAVCRWGSA